MQRIMRPWRAIALTILVPGLILWFYTWALWSGYANLPQRPIPSEGRTYPRGIHGITVYQTLQERNRLDTLFRVSIPVSAVGFVLAALEEERWRRKHQKIYPPKVYRPKNNQ